MKTISKTNRTLLLAAAALVVLPAIAFGIWKFTRNDASPVVAEADYWPTQGWKSSTPEEYGLDSAKLAEGCARSNRKRSRSTV
jgi:hypothetical protein